MDPTKKKLCKVSDKRENRKKLQQENFPLCHSMKRFYAFICLHASLPYPSDGIYIKDLLHKNQTSQKNILSSKKIASDSFPTLKTCYTRANCFNCRLHKWNSICWMKVESEEWEWELHSPKTVESHFVSIAWSSLNGSKRKGGLDNACESGKFSLLRTGLNQRI